MAGNFVQTQVIQDGKCDVPSGNRYGVPGFPSCSRARDESYRDWGAPLCGYVKTGYA